MHLFSKWKKIDFNSECHLSRTEKSVSLFREREVLQVQPVGMEFKVQLVCRVQQDLRVHLEKMVTRLIAVLIDINKLRQ